MSRPRQNELRKRQLDDGTAGGGASSSEVDLTSSAAIAYSSEHPAHPIDHLVDGRSGPGGTRWISARTDATERIVIEFDRPQPISRLIYEVEEIECERTQEVRLEVSSDRGETFRQVLVQEYTFSPGGATFQREDQRFQLEHVDYLRLIIVPNKRGSGTATLTSLRLFH